MVYKLANGLQAGQTVYKLAERLIPRTNGRSCNYFRTCGSLPSAWGSLSFNKRWQSSLTREPHRLYYVFRLRETFRRDTAEMAPCWLHLVASAIDQWPLTALEGLGAIIISRPVHVQARFLTWPRRLIDPLSDSACPRPVLNRANRFIIRLNG